MAQQGQGDRSSDMDTDHSGAGQSKRPAFHHRESETSVASDHTRDSNSSKDHQRSKHHHHNHHHHHHHQKHVVGGGGRLHARIPSSKALHKHHGLTTSKAPPRRHASPSPERVSAAHSHRRAQSDAKLSRDSSSSNLKSNASASSLRRNKSHGEVHKRTKSSDKLKRTASNPAVNKVKSSTTKSSVHFDLGTDAPEDEWVDASGSASPYLSRRGSMASGQSSANKAGGASANNSRPHTPHDQQQPKALSSPDHETAHHKEYLTSRLLQRTPSHGAPPQMTHDTVSVSRSRSPDSLSRQSTLSNDGIAAVKPPAGSAGQDELTSRFVGASSSGGRNDTSFYQSVPRTGSRQTEEVRRPRSAGGSVRARGGTDEEVDDSALAPRSTGHSVAPAGPSRIQQKLNLQRASSVIEPSQAVGGGLGLGGMAMGGGTVGATPLVGVAGPGYDGTSSRDPRVGKQLERTGMEYLSVRRYQNPVARSLERVIHAQEAKMPRRIPPARNGGITPSGNGKVYSRPGTGHTRNVSLGSAVPPPDRRPVTPRAQSIRTLHSIGGGSSYEGDDGRNGGANGLSGSSLVGGEDELATDGINALLRNLWEKSMDLSASQD